MFSPFVKKCLAVFAACIMLAAALCGCAPAREAEIAMLPGSGGIGDSSFNDGVWNGVRLFSGMHGKTFNYYEPSSPKPSSYLRSLRAAERNGAELAILPGQEFSSLLEEIGTQLPDMSFVFLDSGTETTAPNAMNITFASEEAGYLAGYAAVADGYTHLGFIGGEAVNGVVDYGFGFVQGAAAAAKDFGHKVQMKYVYAGTFRQSSRVKALAADWYKNGTELIFAAGGGMNQSVFRAAEENTGYTIGTDVDQSGQSSTVVTTATKHLDNTVGQCLDLFYSGNFPAGEALRYGVQQGAVGLEMSHARFRHFGQEDYNAVLDRVATGEVEIARYTGGPLSPPALAAKGISLDYLGEMSLD